MADTTALYSHRGQEPRLLPNKIILSDKKSRTDASTFTEEELAEVGITGPYVIPSFDQENQRVSWDSKNLSYVVQDISDEELWGNIRKKRNELLASADWIMTADSPESLNFHEWEMYRQRLRDITKTYATPEEVIWPLSPDKLLPEDYDQPILVENRLIWRVRSLEGKVVDLEKLINILNDKVFPKD
jgi:hypothetical protein